MSHKVSRHTVRQQQLASQRRRGSQRRPFLLMAAGVVVLVLVGFLAWRYLNTPQATIEVTGAPSLKVDKEVIDLGDVRLGQTVEASFEITNVGDETLRLTEAPYVEVVEGC
ncbi:MAG: hypothetical protein AB1791_02740 [Chloroflexota bacterium]